MTRLTRGIARIAASAAIAVMAAGCFYVPKDFFTPSNRPPGSIVGDYVAKSGVVQISISPDRGIIERGGSEAVPFLLLSDGPSQTDFLLLRTEPAKPADDGGDPTSTDLLDELYNVTDFVRVSHPSGELREYRWFGGCADIFSKGYLDIVQILKPIGKLSGNETTASSEEIKAWLALAEKSDLLVSLSAGSIGSGVRKGPALFCMPSTMAAFDAAIAHFQQLADRDETPMKPEVFRRAK